MNDSLIARAMSDALIVQAEGIEPYVTEEILAESHRRLADFLPPMFATAVATDPVVRQWVKSLVDAAVAGMKFQHPVTRRGPSLVLAGKAGRGKTWQAWGAVRALAVSGVHCRWRVLGASQLLASLRPRHGVDSEDVFSGLESCEVLVIDDMGATKDSAWASEVFDRLINTRYEWQRPTLITTNVAPKLFEQEFGDRIASRLMAMATVVSFTGPDLRAQR